MSTGPGACLPNADACPVRRSGEPNFATMTVKPLRILLSLRTHAVVDITDIGQEAYFI